MHLLSQVSLHGTCAAFAAYLLLQWLRQMVIATPNTNGTQHQLVPERSTCFMAMVIAMSQPLQVLDQSTACTDSQSLLQTCLCHSAFSSCTSPHTPCAAEDIIADTLLVTNTSSSITKLISNQTHTYYTDSVMSITKAITPYCKPPNCCWPGGCMNRGGCSRGVADILSAMAAGTCLGTNTSHRRAHDHCMLRSSLTIVAGTHSGINTERQTWW